MGVWVGGVCGWVGCVWGGGESVWDGGGGGVGGGGVLVRVCVHLCFISNIQLKFML